MPESLKLVGQLEGHSNWVTCLATSGEDEKMLISGSRDKTLMVCK